MQVEGIGKKTIEKIKRKFKRDKESSPNSKKVYLNSVDLNSIHSGDCIEIMRAMDSNSIDSIVTDPPYNLSFMNKKWDTVGVSQKFQKWTQNWAEEAFRVLKSGAWMLVFGGTRTYHRMVSGVEDAGFEIKDQIDWIYGGGFSKSYNISKGFDKQAGIEREVVGKRKSRGGRTGKNPYQSEDSNFNEEGSEIDITAPATELAKRWDGWGTALKPAHEPILLAQKPYKGTYCNNIEKYGVGGLNIDECRLFSKGRRTQTKNPNAQKGSGNCYTGSDGKAQIEYDKSNKGRFPANIILTHHSECKYKGEKKVKNRSGSVSGDEPSDKTDSTYSNYEKRKKFKAYGEDGTEVIENWDCHSDCPIRVLDEQSGKSSSRQSIVNNKGSIWDSGNNEYDLRGHNDSGGASRFFYCAKTSKKERTIDGMIENKHPTVKPLDLIQYLVKLITPEGAVCLDPFIGSGTTAMACWSLGIYYIGIDKFHSDLAEERIKMYKNYRRRGYHLL